MAATWVTAKHEVACLAPAQLEARFGTSQTGTDANGHTYLGVSLDEYPVGPLPSAPVTRRRVTTLTQTSGGSTTSGPTERSIR